MPPNGTINIFIFCVYMEWEKRHFLEDIRWQCGAICTWPLNVIKSKKDLNVCKILQNNWIPFISDELFCNSYLNMHVYNSHTHTHTHLMALCPGLPR